MKQRAIFSILITSMSVLVLARPAVAADSRQSEARIFEVTKKAATTQQSSFTAFDSEAGASIAVGDVTGDGKDDIVVGSGVGEAPEVRVFSRKGALLSSFAPYASSMTHGVQVAVGDLNQDGVAEIITGTGKGGAPHVRVFNHIGTSQFSSGFFAFDETSRSGVSVAVGNIDGKKGKEIIVGTGSGVEPRVRVFKKDGTFTDMEFVPFASTDLGGVSVATGNLDSDVADEIVMSIQSYGTPWVKVYNADNTIVSSFLAYDEGYYGGVVVTTADSNRNGIAEIITAPQSSGGPHVRIFTPQGKARGIGFFAYESDFRGGVAVAAGNLDADKKLELVTVPKKKNIVGRADMYQYIEVDLSEQRLYAYKNGALDNTFLVSTGVAKYPTPEGLTTVTKKLPTHDYKWSYGEDHPDNYDLKDVPWNLRFRPNYFIHNAYWHNNFGHRMSHGCVNVNLENSKWIYDWTPLGTSVWIHE